MKLTKQLKEEVLKTYQDSWNALLRGDIKTFASLLDDQAVIYGSAAGEIFTTKKAAVKFYTATAGQITGKVDLRKRKIGLKAVNNTVVVHELCEFFFLTGEGWVFYGPARITDILEKKGKAWKIIHHHTSFPDSRTIEGEQFATEKIKAENLLLRDAVQRRTVELEHKNRELEIETSLEKVRSVAMGMKKADDMLLICKTIAQQLAKLGIKEIRNVQTAIFYKSRGTYMNYEYYAKHNQTFITDVNFKNHKIQSGFAKKMMKGPNEEVLEHLKGKKLQDWYAYQKTTNQFADNYLLKAHSLNYYWYSLGPVALGTSTYYPLTKDETDLFKRFLKVFELAYRRYQDIEKATAQAREAQIEAALEKVRSRTLAMQKSDELAETAAVLFQQLIVLGIAPNRLFIILIKEDSPDMEAWLTDEDGSKISMGFTGNYLKNASLLKMYEGWKAKRKTLVIDMQGEELQQYFHYLHAELNVPFKGGLEQKRRVQHLAYFSHGMIGMASPDAQPIETLELLERFAAVFNLTLARFNDLKLAEAHALQAEQDLIAIKEAKQKSEEALMELQATQKQLIQSEKMASLGELTAGIAHEIQNPLNFVNNFSEVSSELIKEMVEEVDKGNTEEVKAIANDVVQNLEKINHHGKRAADIVKGMLQHSRTSSGQKELTDINALADEYLRLAYHGLRAKDKTFNATMKTNFDETIGNINIIPQDIGRVILNLITNAFYVVNEKSKQNIAGYEPTVEVSTKLESGTKAGIPNIPQIIKISVKDNGKGIPQKILDKIFQPFFTTKPTGQGTGLGLSLSYDIVKAHGGELKVDTKEEEGTEFVIQLPL